VKQTRMNRVWVSNGSGRAGGTCLVAGGQGRDRAARGAGRRAREPSSGHRDRDDRGLHRAWAAAFFRDLTARGLTGGPAGRHTARPADLHRPELAVGQQFVTLDWPAARRCMTSGIVSRTVSISIPRGFGTIKLTGRNEWTFVDAPPLDRREASGDPARRLSCTGSTHKRTDRIPLSALRDSDTRPF